jgi:hypothetical protein
MAAARKKYKGGELVRVREAMFSCYFDGPAAGCFS